mmetsp:Transcript_121547/g.349360  ORF Transcript_121547/g.349360 Transcript_121547/m.349360 type:complete len:222 (-) Transcript_121547:143-808(-)
MIAASACGATTRLSSLGARTQRTVARRRFARVTSAAARAPGRAPGRRRPLPQQRRHHRPQHRRPRPQRPHHSQPRRRRPRQPRRHPRPPLAQASAHGSQRRTSRRFSRTSTTRRARGRASSATRPWCRRRRPFLSSRTPGTSSKTSASWPRSWGRRATRRPGAGPRRPAALRLGASASRRRWDARAASARSTARGETRAGSSASIAPAWPGRPTTAEAPCS